MPRHVIVGLLTLGGCTQTSNVTTASGIRCQTTVHNYVVTASTSSQCWIKNGRRSLTRSKPARRTIVIRRDAAPGALPTEENGFRRVLESGPAQLGTQREVAAKAIVLFNSIPSLWISADLLVLFWAFTSLNLRRRRWRC